jgi:hypothetical protein
MNQEKMRQPLIRNAIIISDRIPWRQKNPIANPDLRSTWCVECPMCGDKSLVEFIGCELSTRCFRKDRPEYDELTMGFGCNSCGHLFSMSAIVHGTIQDQNLIWRFGMRKIKAIIDEHTAAICRKLDGALVTAITMPPHKVKKGESPCRCVLVNTNNRRRKRKRCE